jgi:FkbM family methyltransferase
MVNPTRRDPTMQSIGSKIRYLVNARRFGLPVRRRSFSLPQEIRIGVTRVPLAHPAERGIENDFLTCFMADEYGLWHARGPVKTILDIGSNVGFFAMAARARFSGATVHAYEPNPRVLPFLRQNAAACRVEVFAEAVGDQEGVVTIVDMGDSNQARTSSSGTSGVKAPQVSLSTAVNRIGGSVDLAKFDCEGAEWQLFQDAEPWRQIRSVRMEYHLWGRHLYREVEQALGTLGFFIEHHAPALGGEWGTVWAARRTT